MQTQPQSQPTPEFPDLSEEMARRRAEIRNRLGLQSVSNADSACAPTDCASCPSACHPERNVGLPLSEAYETC